VVRKPKDKDFVESAEGLFFCVVGYLHPPDAYTAYLKYRPEAGGRWQRSGTHYQRMMKSYSAAEVGEATAWLREHLPDYVRNDPVRNVELPLIPRDRVIRYYAPEVRMVEILGAPQDSLEKKTRDLVDRLAEVSGVPVSRFGVTGSILLDIHDPAFSDIDLVVFGAESARRVRSSVQSAYDAGQLRPHTAKEVRAWQQRQCEILGIPLQYAKRLVWPNWQRARIEKTPYSLHATRTDEEILDTYGAETYTALGTVEVSATIADDRESLFVPASYGLQDVVVHEGASDLPTISEVVSFEGIFAGCASQGDRVRTRGTLEAVRDSKTGRTRNHIVIGSFSSRGWLIRL
jgi:predicted nucleotidyltransferase